MSLMDYGRILWRRGWILIVLAVIGGASAWFLSRQMTPIYRSTQTILLVPSRSDFGLAEATIRLLKSHETYLNSQIRAQEVIDTLSLDMTPGELMQATTITSNQNDLSLSIDVDLADGNLANDVARVWGDLLIQYRNDLNQRAQRQDRIEPVRQDNPRFGLLRPSIPINTIIGAVGGFFLGGVIVFVLEYLESNMIRRRDDVERLELPVLATIPE